MSGQRNGHGPSSPRNGAGSNGATNGATNGAANGATNGAANGSARAKGAASAAPATVAAGEGVIRLEVPCSLAYRDVAARVVTGACQLVERRADGNFEAQVVSAFNEAFTNAVRHGGAAEGASLAVEIEPHAGGLTVRLMDRGRSFELSSVPAPDLDALPESGMGVHVMRSWMDDLSYRAGDPNVLSMTKRVAGFTRTDAGAETTLRVEGVLDAVTAPDLRPTIEALVAERRRSITVDLGALRLIDSSGVGVIVSLFKRCHAFGGEVRVTGLKDQPLQIFRLLRLDRIFAIP